VNPDLSLGQLVAGLEQQIASLREREAHHARHEAHHREQRTATVAELARLTGYLETLRNSAAVLDGIPAPPVSSDHELPADKKATINLAAGKVISGFPPDRPFGPREVAAEINRRFSERLGGPVSVRQVSVSLRWMARTRRIYRIARGKPHHGAQYVREKPPRH